MQPGILPQDRTEMAGVPHTFRAVIRLLSHDGFWCTCNNAYPWGDREIAHCS